MFLVLREFQVVLSAQSTLLKTPLLPQSRFLVVTPLLKASLLVQ